MACLAVSKSAPSTRVEDEAQPQGEPGGGDAVGVVLGPPMSPLSGQVVEKPVSQDKDQSAQQPKKVGGQAVPRYRCLEQPLAVK